MNIKTTISIILITAFANFACQHRSANAGNENEKAALHKKTEIVNVSAIVRANDSLHSTIALRSKRKSCCVGAPSRFKASTQFAKNVTKSTN